MATPCSRLTSLPIRTNYPLSRACPLQATELWWPRVGWGSGEGGVAVTSLQPRGPWPLVALCFPPTSSFQPISSLRRLRSTDMLGTLSRSLETTSTEVDIGSSSCLSCSNCQCHSRYRMRRRSTSDLGKIWSLARHWS